MKRKNKIRLLYAPYNIASMPAITLDEISEQWGIAIKGICIDYNQNINFGKKENEVWLKFKVDSNHKNLVKYFINLFFAELSLCYYISVSDIIIWQWDIKKYLPHFWLIKLLRKKMFVEWVGSDIRNPNFLSKINKYYKQALDSGTYTYKKESQRRSEKIQRKFAYLGAYPIVCPEMELYVDKSLFDRVFILFQRINVSDFLPQYPSSVTTVPKLCHAPSAAGAKGTDQLRQIIRKLKATLDFEYVELSGVPREEVLKIMATCDIFLDQFILGAYGMAAMEAMCLGKPVFCYIVPEVKRLLPPDCPIIDVGLDDIEPVLITYIKDAQLRYDRGRLSRQYAEKYHDAKLLVGKLHEIFTAQGLWSQFDETHLG